MNDSNRILSAIGLFTVVIVLTAVVSFGSIWAYHALFEPRPAVETTSRPVSAALPEPAPPSSPEPPATMPGQQESVAAPKVIPTETFSPAEAVSPAKTDPRFCVWDPDRLMSASAAGKAIDAYARGYAGVMDKNIAALNAALASKDPRFNAAEARKLIAQFRERKTSAPADARKLLLSLAVETVKSLDGYENAFLIEKSAVTLAPDSADITPALIAEFDRMKLNLPQLPKPLRLPEPPKAQKPPEQPKSSARRGK